MFCHTIKPVTKMIAEDGVRNFSITPQIRFKVAVAGAAGGIGQPLSLLLKLNSQITHLALYDISKITPGVAVDVSHVTTKTMVTGHKGPDEICEAFKDTDIVMVPAGMARKPGMKREDLFAANASVVCELATSFAKYAPSHAIFAIITNPVNSMLPIACEVIKKVGVFDPKRVIGVTTLDIVRASTFIGQINCIDPSEVYIPVVGGHSGETIVPVLSQAKPPVNLCCEEDIRKLISKIQEAGTTVLNAKAGGGTATLAMAYAGAKLTSSLLKGLAGESNVVECVMVESNVSEAKYFANPVLLGRNGVECNYGYGTLNDLEKSLLEKAMPTLLKNIKTGEAFVNKSDSDNYCHVNNIENVETT